MTLPFYYFFSFDICVGVSCLSVHTCSICSVCVCWQLMHLKSAGMRRLLSGPYQTKAIVRNSLKADWFMFECSQTKQMPFCKVSIPMAEEQQRNLEALWRPHSKSVVEPDLNSEVPGLWPGAQASCAQLYWIVNRNNALFPNALGEHSWFN